MRVLLLDDSFTGLAGHNAGYNFSICDELQLRSIETILFACQKLRDATLQYPNIIYAFKQFGLATSFRKRRFPFGLSGLFNLISANYQHLRDLLSNVDGHVQADDLLIVCYQSAFTSFAYAFWLGLLAFRGKRPKIVFVLHNGHLRFWKMEMAAFRMLGLVDQVRLVAHTPNVAALATLISDLRCVVFPLPFVKELPSTSPNQFTLTPITFVFPGNARYLKGFDLVIESIAHLADLFQDQTIRFRLQCNSKPESDSMAKLIDLLNRHVKQLPGIELVTSMLDEKEYYSLLNSADIVLIPNRAEWYRSALSGVLAEALALGKPTIVADGSYMANELAQKGSALLFNDGDAKSLAESIRKAPSQLVKLRTSASQMKSEWLAFHNPHHYVDMLLEIAK